VTKAKTKKKLRVSSSNYNTVFLTLADFIPGIAMRFKKAESLLVPAGNMYWLSWIEKTTHEVIKKDDWPPSKSTSACLDGRKEGRGGLSCLLVQEDGEHIELRLR